MGAKMRDLNEKLKAEFGLDIKYGKDVIGEGLYLDHELLAQNKLCLEKVKAAAIRILKTDPDLQCVMVARATSSSCRASTTSSGP